VQGWIPPADGSESAQIASGGALLQAVGIVSALVLSAVLGNYLVQLSSTSKRIADDSQGKLTSLKQQQNTLIDSLKEGIMSTDSNAIVIDVNASTELLFGKSKTQLIGRKIQAILEDASNSFLPEHLNESSTGCFTVVVDSDSGHQRHLLCERHTVSSSSVDEAKYLFVFQDVTQLRSIEEQLLVHERMTRLLAEQRGDSIAESHNSICHELIGEAPIMRKVFSLIERVSKSDATVLIGGESGTGKELAARAIHQLSSRRSRPFIAVNCGAIPENLIESELFGHKKGAFTGAINDHHGLFKQAEGGTLFLDEIGELPIAMQAKLLRALQERTVRSVGGERDMPVDVRIIGATNRNLKN
jgi:PAS domain S-box-containing protein